MKGMTNAQKDVSDLATKGELTQKADQSALDSTNTEVAKKANQSDLTALQTTVEGKQDKLTAGEGITIVGTEISATPSSQNVSINAMLKPVSAYISSLSYGTSSTSSEPVAAIGYTASKIVYANGLFIIAPDTYTYNLSKDGTSYYLRSLRKYIDPRLPQCIQINSLPDGVYQFYVYIGICKYYTWLSDAKYKCTAIFKNNLIQHIYLSDSGYQIDYFSGSNNSGTGATLYLWPVNLSKHSSSSFKLKINNSCGRSISISCDNPDVSVPSTLQNLNDANITINKQIIDGFTLTFTVPDSCILGENYGCKIITSESGSGKIVCKIFAFDESYIEITKSS